MNTNKKDWRRSNLLLIRVHACSFVDPFHGNYQMTEFPSLWIELGNRASLSLSEAQLQQLAQYLDLLSAANERMNLTRITDRAAAEVQHVGDALTVLPYLPKRS